MVAPLIECVPNFSEGRRREVIDALARAVRDVGGTRLLDVSADPDHNRVVLTVIGSAKAVSEAARRSAEVAVARIDLRAHKGVHPRIGAVDVIPFVPLYGASLAECAALARRLGHELASDLGLPVYLYAAAARDPHHTTLVEIRRGGFEGLRETIARPDRRPDLGPAHVHPTAGAVAVGARDVLIAFNVNLRSADVRVARMIARAVRESSGGLPAVQAMGVPLPSRGLVQVSMNLLDYRTTPLQAVFDRVAAEAAHRGVQVEDSELIGCAPREALPAGPLAALRLRGLRPGQILDPPRLAQEMALGDAHGGGGCP
jgi:glutamate formiminotransferase